MTELKGISSGITITTKNNMNNVMVGNNIVVDESMGKRRIVGTVVRVDHYVTKYINHEGLERSTHDIIIYIKENKK